MLTAEQARDVECLYGTVWRIANALARKLPSHIDAEDLAQQAFVELCAARVRWRPEMSPWPQYGTRRAKGAMLDYLRRSWFGQRDNRDEPQPVSATEILGCRDDWVLPRSLVAFERGYDEVEVRADLDAALTSFEPYVRRTVDMILGELSLREVGERERVGESAICRRMTSVRAALEYLHD